MTDEGRQSLADYDRGEFLALVEKLWTGEVADEAEADRLTLHFGKIVPHPDKQDLIFWPPEGVKSPEDVVRFLEDYCAQNGIPGFRSP